MSIMRALNGRKIVDSDAIHFTPQTLTEEQKAQARENIGAGGGLSLHDIILDHSSIKEEDWSDGELIRRVWKKRADGTFWLWGEIPFEMTPEWTEVVNSIEGLPFDVLAVDKVTSAFYVDYVDGYDGDVDWILDSLTTTVCSLHEESGEIEYAHCIGITIETDEDTLEKMTELGIECAVIVPSLYVEGRWRE